MLWVHTPLNNYTTLRRASERTIVLVNNNIPSPIWTIPLIALHAKRKWNDFVSECVLHVCAFVCLKHRPKQMRVRHFISEWIIKFMTNEKWLNRHGDCKRNHLYYRSTRSTPLCSAGWLINCRTGNENRLSSARSIERIAGLSGHLLWCREQQKKWLLWTIPIFFVCVHKHKTVHQIPPPHAHIPECYIQQIEFIKCILSNNFERKNRTKSCLNSNAFEKAEGTSPTTSTTTTAISHTTPPTKENQNRTKIKKNSWNNHEPHTKRYLVTRK